MIRPFVQVFIQRFCMHVVFHPCVLRVPTITLFCGRSKYLVKSTNCEAPEQVSGIFYVVLSATSRLLYLKIINALFTNTPLVRPFVGMTDEAWHL
jgi:hypothetical protein